jgi:hypothetical protein
MTAPGACQALAIDPETYPLEKPIARRIDGFSEDQRPNEVLTVISTGLARHLQRIERLAGTLAPRVDKHTGNVRS